MSPSSTAVNGLTTTARHVRLPQSAILAKLLKSHRVDLHVPVFHQDGEGVKDLYIIWKVDL
jgi:hypothetical protein